MLPTPLDHALDLIHDWVMLVLAQSQLRAKLKAIKTDPVQAVLHSCIVAMLGLFNVFLNKKLSYI
jgi:hypothetical protein